VSAAEAISDAEADRLFSDLADTPALAIAVSGGPDSTALLVLLARWRKRRGRGPALVAVTVDHGLRKGARREALTVKRLAQSLGIAHRVLRWTGDKPASALQAKAREARYRLLSRAAKLAGARHILTAHTLDDQAETVLIRLARGSGIAGLGAMERASLVPPHGPVRRGASELLLVRPLLGLPKARLVATLDAAGIPFADDPSNRDPRFLRARLRGLMPQLAGEGLHAARLATFADRMRRADAAVEAVVDAVMRRVTRSATGLSIDAGLFGSLPEEVALRVLGRAIDLVGDEGAAELGKLEALAGDIAAAVAAGMRIRRTLAGAMVTAAGAAIAVQRAPARRNRPAGPHKSHRRARKPSFTTVG
jgi:tRNA(Ile)-lysidine synthase